DHHEQGRADQDQVVAGLEGDVGPPAREGVAVAGRPGRPDGPLDVVEQGPGEEEAGQEGGEGHQLDPGDVGDPQNPDAAGGVDPAQKVQGQEVKPQEAEQVVQPGRGVAAQEGGPLVGGKEQAEAEVPGQDPGQPDQGGGAGPGEQRAASLPE